MAAQDFHPDGMKRAKPRHSLNDLPDHHADAALHLARGLVGEGDGQHLVWPRAAERKNVGDTRGQHPRLAGPRTGQHQQRPVERLDRLALLRVQAREVGRCDIRARTRRDAAGGGACELLT